MRTHINTRAVSGPVSRSEMKLWILRPVNALEPPFHFTGTPMTIIVAAPNEHRARRLASSEGGGDAWADKAMASCEELEATAPGVIARDFTEA